MKFNRVHTQVHLGQSNTRIDTHTHTHTFLSKSHVRHIHVFKQLYVDRWMDGYRLVDIKDMKLFETIYIYTHIHAKKVTKQFWMDTFSSMSSLAAGGCFPNVPCPSACSRLRDEEGRSGGLKRQVIS